jgi:flagellar biosynthesis chaperone FliJ
MATSSDNITQEEKYLNALENPKNVAVVQAVQKFMQHAMALDKLEAEIAKHKSAIEEGPAQIERLEAVVKVEKERLLKLKEAVAVAFIKQN